MCDYVLKFSEIWLSSTNNIVYVLKATEIWVKFN